MTERVGFSITLPKELLAKVDRNAEQLKMDRSHYIEFVLENSQPPIERLKQVLQEAWSKSPNE